MWGHEAALRAVDGVAFSRWGAGPDEPVEFCVQVDDLVWTLRFPMSAQGLKGTYGEELRRSGAVVLRAAMFDDGWYEGSERQERDAQRCCAKLLWDRGTTPWMQPLVDALEGIRTYETYWLNQVKDVRSVGATDSYLHGTGRNLWSVLANWKGSPLRYHGQFDWVIREARKAFPNLIGNIEFDRGLPYLFRPGATDPAEGLLPNRAADGLLTGLLHLTAVAGARPGSLVAFDEVENQLHPHAIRTLIAAMRQQADERELTIVLTTHSPVVLNQFRDEPEQVYVLGHGVAALDVPAPMTALHTEEWIAQAKLGSLYERLAFGAPELGGDV
ncbi:MAG: ATP-binding protein [Myxococcales bacterium]|nr:ATP-binding protein [Myxococcales bacterium]